MGHSYLMYYMTGFIMIPVFLFALACQFSVKSNFNKYSKIANSRGMTGADAAFRLLQLNGITDVRIKVISGTLTDYYDPKNKEICLSQDVFSSVIPATRIGTWLGVPLCLIGVAINSEAMAYIGLAFYGFVALFQLITLPVEFDASKRALATIQNNFYFTDDEYSGAKKVLTAAALTYVAALASALATIFRLLLIIAGGNRRR